MRSVFLVLASVALVTAGCSDDGGQSPAKDLSVDMVLKPDLPGNLEAIYNADPSECTNHDGAVYRGTAEQPIWATARLTPPSYPFTVVQVAYLLWSKNNNSSIQTCDAHIPHKVAVWVSDKTTPEASPTLAFTTDVPRWDSPLTMEARVVEVDLDTPLQLKSGEHLYVAVFVQRDPADAALCMCLEMCHGEGLGERSFYTEDATPPHTWVDFYLDDSHDFTLTTSALGYPG